MFLLMMDWIVSLASLSLVEQDRFLLEQRDFIGSDIARVSSVNFPEFSALPESASKATIALKTREISRLTKQGEGGTRQALACFLQTCDSQGRIDLGAIDIQLSCVICLKSDFHVLATA
jgi:hypothetical protein